MRWSTLLNDHCYQYFRFKSLVALLFHHIEIGQRRGSCYEGADRDLGLKATSLYFILLAIPGSSAFNIFHPMLYSKALTTFKLATKLHEVRISVLENNSYDPSSILREYGHM